MATYEDVLAEILYEITNRPRLSIQALIAPLREVLEYEIKLEDTLTETEREAWLMKLRLEKPRILHWLAREDTLRRVMANGAQKAITAALKSGKV